MISAKVGAYPAQIPTIGWPQKRHFPPTISLPCTVELRSGFITLAGKLVKKSENHKSENQQSVDFVNISSNCHLVTRALLNHSLSPLPNEHFAVTVVLSEERESM